MWRRILSASRAVMIWTGISVVIYAWISVVMVPSSIRIHIIVCAREPTVITVGVSTRITAVMVLIWDGVSILVIVSTSIAAVIIARSHGVGWKMSSIEIRAMAGHRIRRTIRHWITVRIIRIRVHTAVRIWIRHRHWIGIAILWRLVRTHVTVSIPPIVMAVGVARVIAVSFHAT